MKLIVKMVFLIIPLAIVTVIALVVLTFYLLFNISKFKKAVESDDPIFLED